MNLRNLFFLFIFQEDILKEYFSFKKYDELNSDNSINSDISKCKYYNKLKLLKKPCNAASYKLHNKIKRNLDALSKISYIQNYKD